MISLQTEGKHTKPNLNHNPLASPNSNTIVHGLSTVHSRFLTIFQCEDTSPDYYDQSYSYNDLYIGRRNDADSGYGSHTVSDVLFWDRWKTRWDIWDMFSSTSHCKDFSLFYIVHLLLSLWALLKVLDSKHYIFPITDREYPNGHEGERTFAES